MEAPTGRRAGRRIRAGSLALVATVFSMMSAAPVYAEPSAPPVESPASGAPTPGPTDGPPTQEPPPGPPVSATAALPPPRPAPAHRFRMTVSTVALGDAYWLGDGSAELVISIMNTGENVGNDTITGYYAFPGGAQAVAAYGTAGCAVANGSLSFSCTLAEQAMGQLVVKVNVDAGAWKVIANGLVTASIGQQQRTAPISFTFTTPPAPGVDLSASGPPLPAVATPQDQNTQLQVRLRNTGATKGGAAVEVVTPPGVDLVTFPAACRSHRRIGNDRDRCELGDLAAGREVSGAFGLVVTAAARAGLPLTVAVHGYLTPAGRETIETRFDYLITAPPVAGEAPLPTSAPAAPPANGGTDPTLRRQVGDGRTDSEPLSSVPFIAAVVGLVAVLGGLVVFSLRRRMADGAEDDELRPDEVEEIVLMPGQRITDENRAMVLPTSSIREVPRAADRAR